MSSSTKTDSFNLHFSLVLYMHYIDDVLPLFSSLRSLSISLSSSSSIHLSIYDNSNKALILPSQVTSSLGDLVSFRYFHDGKNIGFASAHNFNYQSHANTGTYGQSFFIPVNPDIYFSDASLLNLLHWLSLHVDVVCCAPLVKNQHGSKQFSAKTNPTLLSLLASRFAFLRRFPFILSYMARHHNLHSDYSADIIYSSYLSGCFLIVRSFAYRAVGGFSQSFFLHLEDADLTRKLQKIGFCVHCPVGSVVHLWARGSHHSLMQMFHLFRSYINYTRLWGFRLF